MSCGAGNRACNEIQSDVWPAIDRIERALVLMAQAMLDKRITNIGELETQLEALKAKIG